VAKNDEFDLEKKRTAAAAALNYQPSHERKPEKEALIPLYRYALEG
jgi:hypothetical protein